MATITRYISSRVRLHDSLRVTFKPPTPLDVAEFRWATTGKSTVDALREAAKVSIVSWSAEIQPTEDAFLTQLHPELVDRLTVIVVYAIDGGDDDPDDPIVDFLGK